MIQLPVFKKSGWKELIQDIYRIPKLIRQSRQFDQILEKNTSISLKPSLLNESWM